MLEPPRFAVDDPAGDTYLREHGYTVYRDAVAASEVGHAHDLMWEFLGGLGTGIRRDDPETWHDAAWPQNHSNGAIAGYGVGQSAMLWYLRARPSIRQVFARLWNDDQLLVSFDGFGVFRPRAYNRAWATTGGWYHFDQNGAHREGLHCYQGIVNLTDAGPDKGGLVVVPDSIHWFPQVFTRFPELAKAKNDFVKLTEAQIGSMGATGPSKVCCRAGDLIVWDSRTLHCNTPAIVEPAPSREAVLERVVAYICMTPRKLAGAELPLLIENRRRAIAQGLTTDHWPHKYSPSYVDRERSTAPASYVPPTLDAVQLGLAGLIDP